MAPGCPRRAAWIARGVDYNGSHFTEHVCESCAGYLLECGAKLESIATGRDYWEVVGDAA